MNSCFLLEGFYFWSDISSHPADIRAHIPQIDLYPTQQGLNIPIYIT